MPSYPERVAAQRCLLRPIEARLGPYSSVVAYSGSQKVGASICWGPQRKQWELGAESMQTKKFSTFCLDRESIQELVGAHCRDSLPELLISTN